MIYTRGVTHHESCQAIEHCDGPTRQNIDRTPSIFEPRTDYQYFGLAAPFGGSDTREQMPTEVEDKAVGRTIWDVLYSALHNRWAIIAIVTSLLAVTAAVFYGWVRVVYTTDGLSVEAFSAEAAK